ncbi:MBL fold metallo-hydrolase [Sphingorhabdus sp. YGSMI21]|uniref:MBL fold metallo-hydrolase n=1 Tax=Sphingorhabdus sp. YGSMI21 TaxID=2077182 RepID=UPI0013DB8C37|nr:MBL fold metallo-hydrolase [Sphingorhabdus sp. YGSMI21]
MRSDRSQPANLLVVEGKPYLVDCGEGCVTQLRKAGFEPGDVEQLFLTHMHLDHSAGVGPLAAFRWTGSVTSQLTVFGPPGTSKFVDAAMRYLSVPGSVHSREVPNMGSMDMLVHGEDIKHGGPEAFELFSDEKIRVRAVENSHFDHLSGVDIGFGALRSYSYRFDSADRSIVFTGDTGPSQSLQRMASGADILVAEIMDVDGVMSAFRQRTDIPAAQFPVIEAQMRAKHLTARDVGELAQASGVKTVILTHFASAGAGTEDVERFLREVSEVFDGKVVAGKDLQIF